MLHESINRENLRILMRDFYENAILDPEIGHFFLNELGDNLDDEDWVEHIELLADFWLAMMLGEDTYYGNFIGAHVKLPRIFAQHLDIWLFLFAKSADAVYVPDIATAFKKKAHIFSKQFLTTSKKI